MHADTADFSACVVQCDAVGAAGGRGANLEYGATSRDGHDEVQQNVVGAVNGSFEKGDDEIHAPRCY